MHVFMVLPISPRLRSFILNVPLHPWGSLGAQGPEFYPGIVDILLASKVQIISITTDGDRGYCPYQTNLIGEY
jgi:hypothetical protein